MNRIRMLRLGVALIVLVGAGGLWWWHAGNRASVRDKLELYGNVDIRQVELAFNGAERVATMRVDEGDRVKQGELLATLDTQRLKYAVAQAQAQVAAQRAVVAQLEAGTRREQIRKDRADMEAAAAEAVNAERTARRFQQLAAQHLVSSQQVDDARTAANAAHARLAAAKAVLALAIAGPRKEDIDAAQATLKAYEATLALEQRQLADASLYAPADGVIQNRILEPGDMASPQQPVYTMALTNPVWVRAYVSARDLGRIWEGMRAEVYTDSYPGKAYRAWVGFISPTAEFTPKSVETREVRTSLVYQVRVFVCNSENQLRLGMPATVTLALDQPHTPTGQTVERCQGP